MKKEWIKRIAAIAGACLIGLPTTASLVVSAAEMDVNEYDETRVIDDLGSSTLASLAVDAGLEYKDADPTLYTMAEYCYSEDEAITSEKFGIYLYVYNPSRIEIEQDNGVNVVNIATSYVDGEPSEYSNMRLKFCGQSSGDYDKLVYKFRVLDSEAMLAAGREGMTSDGERRYDIAGIQLLHKDAQTATDYAVSKTYFYSGYALGCDEESEEKSTLKVSVKELDTVDVSLEHTMWRNQGDRMQVNTAYFGIDADVMATYGDLQKIKAQWYEYHTKPMFVVQEKEAYDAIWQYGVGKNAKNGISGLDWRIVWGEDWQNVYDPTSFGSIINMAWEEITGQEECRLLYSWNVPTWFEAYYDNDTYMMHEDWMNLEQLDWLFYTGKIDAADDWNISRQEVLEYAATYTTAKGTSGGLYQDGPNKYSAALFEQDMDEDRKVYLVDQNADCGLCRYEFDVGADTWNWTSSLWEQIIECKRREWTNAMIGIKGTSSYRRRYTDEQVEEMVLALKEKHSLYDLDPFVTLTASDLALATTDFATKFYISEDEAAKVKEDCLAMLDAGKVPVLFRFAVTEYAAGRVRVDKISDENMSGRDGYVAFQTVFLDFDVLSFTFWQDGKETVLGCVASPIDIINGIDAPAGMPVPSEEMDLWYVIGLVLGIVGTAAAAIGIVALVVWFRNQWNGGY